MSHRKKHSARLDIPAIDPVRTDRRFDWTIFFTGILAFFAATSFVALWIQLSDARKSFAKDQRPYVWMANDTKDDAAVYVRVVTNTLNQKQMITTMRYTNFGKSPAILVRSYHAMILGPSSDQIRSMPWNESKTIMPSGKVDFFTDASGPVSDQAVATYSDAQEGTGVTIYGTWQYLDTSGNKYETEICLTRLNLGSWAFCPIHNDIKDCSDARCEP